MFSYPHIDDKLPLAEQKRLALIRRSDKLIAWLRGPDYATYIDDSSTEQLAKLINLVIYALEMSLPQADWKPFKRKLLNLKQMLMGFPEHEDNVKFEPDERANYENTIAALLVILEKYKEVVATSSLT